MLDAAVTAIDIHLFRTIHDALGGWIALMAALTVVGGGWGALSIVPLFGPSRTRRFALAFTATIVVDTVLVYLLKVIVARPRPWMVLPDIHPLVFPGPSDFSFPSGHAAGSFCYAAFISVFVLRTRTGVARHLLVAVLLALATGVCLSRIALGVHFPADVAAGAIIGSTVGALGAHLFVTRWRARGRADGGGDRPRSGDAPVDP